MTSTPVEVIVHSTNPTSGVEENQELDSVEHTPTLDNCINSSDHSGGDGDGSKVSPTPTQSHVVHPSKSPAARQLDYSPDNVISVNRNYRCPLCRKYYRGKFSQHLRKKERAHIRQSCKRHFFGKRS